MTFTQFREIVIMADLSLIFGLMAWGLGNLIPVVLKARARARRRFLVRQALGR